MALPNRASLHPGLLWLTLALILINQWSSRYNMFFFNFAHTVGCFRVSPRARVPQIEYHWARRLVRLQSLSACVGEREMLTSLGIRIAVYQAD
jgi:hypothetical protein